MSKELIFNAIRTPDGTVLVSRYTHDYVTYMDTTNGLVYMVDGGLDYLRRNSHDNHPYEELACYNTDDFEKIRKGFCRGGRGINSDESLTWTPLCEMSDQWLENCIIYNKSNSESFSTKMYQKEIQYRKDKLKKQPISLIKKILFKKI